MGSHASRPACELCGYGSVGRSPRSALRARRLQCGAPTGTRGASVARAVGRAAQQSCVRDAGVVGRRAQAPAHYESARHRRGGGRREARRRRQALAETIRRATLREQATTARTRPRGGLARGRCVPPRPPRAARPPPRPVIDTARCTRLHRRVNTARSRSAATDVARGAACPTSSLSISAGRGTPPCARCPPAGHHGTYITADTRPFNCLHHNVSILRGAKDSCLNLAIHRILLIAE